MGHGAKSFTYFTRVLAFAVLSAASSASSADREAAYNRQWAETAFSASSSRPLPFSFVYGGRASSTFIGTWPRQITDRVVDAAARIRTLTITDPATGLQIRAICTIFTDSPGADLTLTFTNTGTADTPVIEQLKAVDVSIVPGPGPAPVLHRLKGSTCADDDWLPFDQPLSPGASYEFGAQNGRSSADSPFFNLQYGGGGVITAVGWSGQWRGMVEHQPNGALHIAAEQQNLRTVLHAGESLRSLRIMQL
jgi:alpha-galactosidase